MKNLKIAFWLLVFTPLIILLLESCGSTQTATPKTAEEATETNDMRYLAPSGAKDSLRVAFYNVENLFDTIDEPMKIDSEYMPNSSLKWTRIRYEAKQKNIVKVFEGMGFPSVVGLVEIENRRVLEDLVTELKKNNQIYQIAHFESPDERGIDVAMLYKTADFQLKNQKAHPIIFKNFPDKTRDILEVNGLLRGTEVTIFVNHWPSRRGGADTSEPKRMFVAETLKARTDALFAKNPNSRIIIMGDLNDEPSNISLTRSLQAIYWNRDSSKVLKHNQLYNLGAGVKRAGKGSYYYRGEWEVIDQIIVSGIFLDGRAKMQTTDSETVFNADFLTYKDRNGNKLPNRTYTGPVYRGGFSDHFPIYVNVYFK